MIPLMMQEGYEADGWLGLLLGTSLWYALYGSTLESESSFEDRMSALARELGSRGRAAAVVAAGAPEPCPEPGQGESAQASVLRSELDELKLSALRKRAVATDAGEIDIEEAEDAEDPKAAMIALIIAREQLTAYPAAVLRKDLESLKPSALRKLSLIHI